eukprot:PhF_6_TR6879/c0_g1_i1/m.9899/K15376/GPHN; gephyrin
MEFRGIVCGVLTVSDRCSKGLATDTASDAVVKILKAKSATVLPVSLCPDDIQDIQFNVLALIRAGANLVLTVGGTGFTPRDVTPEAVKPLFTKECSAFVHNMIVTAAQTHTPVAALSRAVGGVIGKTLLITLPGSKAGATENLGVVLSLLPHAITHTTGLRLDQHPGDQTKTANRLAPSICTRPRKSTYPMLTMDVALKLVYEKTHSPRYTAIAVERSLRCILAENIISAINVPPFRASVKDGYAVIAEDGLGVFPVAATMAAGQDPSAVQLQKGSVCRVTTGSAVPNGADSVIQVEDTSLVSFDEKSDTELTIKIEKAAKMGQDIRPIGCDIAIGQTILTQGAVLGPAEIGLISSVGVQNIKVCSPPIIGVLSTGDELVENGCPASAGVIYDSNRPMLIAAINDLFGASVNVRDLGICPDDPALTEEFITKSLQHCDVVISSGGVSMGEHDLIKNTVIKCGGTIHFGRVHMKPGKPTTFATVNESSWIGLPGNPVSALVCFYLFVVPCVRKLLGFPESQAHLQSIKAIYEGEPLPLDVERPEYHRCNVTYNREKKIFLCKSTGLQASHRLLSLHTANGLMYLPCKTEAQPSCVQGSEVEVVLIDKFSS